MTRTRFSAVSALMMTAFVAGGCAQKVEPTAQAHTLNEYSSCSAYLKAADADQAHSLRVVAAQLGVPEAVTPAGMAQVDSNCVQRPELSLRESVSSLAEGSPSTSPSATDTASVAVGPEVQALTEQAIVTSLSYSWRTIDSDVAAAQAVATSSYWRRAEGVWGAVRANVGRTSVTTKVLDIALIGIGADRTASYLAFVNRPTSRAGGTLTVYRDVVVATMAPSGGTWLVDDIATDDHAVSARPDAVTAAPVARAADFVRAIGTYGPAMLDPEGHLIEYAKSVEPTLAPSFLASFRSQLRTAESMVREGQVNRTTEIAAAAATEVEDGKAVVLVAGRFQDSFNGKRNELTTFRFRVTLTKGGDKWLVEDFATVS